MAAFQGNAFALLDGDEGENLFPAVAAASVKAAAAAPPPANNHPRKSPTSFYEHNSRNGLDRQNRNRDAVERFNRNGAVPNNGAVEKHNGNGTVPNNGAVERPFRNGGGRAYNGNGYRRERRPFSNSLKPTNGVSNGNEKEGEEEGWETVRAKASKQRNFNANFRGRRNGRSYFNANSRGHSRSSNGRNPSENGNGRNPSENGDGSLHRRRESVQVVENGGNDDSVQVVENGGNDDKLVHENENEAKSDEACDKEEKVLSKEEIVRLKLEAENLAKIQARKLENELEAKRMTLKQYEKILEEDRKVLESMKPIEERRVEVDTSFNSMHLIAKKNNIEEDNFPKLKKAESKNKDDNNNNTSVKAKRMTLEQYEKLLEENRKVESKNKDDNNNNNTSVKAKKVGKPRIHPGGDTSSKSDSIPIPVSAKREPSPPRIPLFEDVDQFPALKSNATTKRK